ncbi:MAG: hypothetical protein IPK62_08995 [Bacteroidetes bacterium]|nr:hypothetical protein [Bacteroidota bacterium]
MLPFRLMLDGISGMRSLLKGEWVEVRTIIKAHWSFFLSFGKWYRKRQVSISLISKKNDFGIYPYSIIAAYFLKKKTKFTDLHFDTKKISNS